MPKILTWALAICERGPERGLQVLLICASWIVVVDALLLGQPAPIGTQVVVGLGGLHLCVWMIALVVVLFTPPPGDWGGGGRGDDPDPGPPPVPSSPRRRSRRHSRSRPALYGRRRAHPGARKRVRSPVRSCTAQGRFILYTPFGCLAVE